MYRPLKLRFARPAVYLPVFRKQIAARRLATSTPDGQPHGTPHRSEGSNAIIILSALGALGGLYYYYTRGQPGIDREAARRKEEDAEKKVRDIGESARGKLESTGKQVKGEYDQAKESARTRATEVGNETTDRVRKNTHDAQVKYDELKNAAEQKIGDVRDRSGKLIEESKEEVARRAREAENKTRNWFGWGSSK